MSNSRQPIELVLTGQATAADQCTYRNLPFEVPDGVTRLDVRYTYSDAVGSDPELTNGNTVDIGIFDPRGAAFLASGFRGWSGSARDHFYIARDHATPGYLDGPIQPGTWHIALGLYKIWERGCDYQVTITLTLEPAATTEIAFPALLRLSDAPAPREPSPDGWYRGELHCHSVHSDGDAEVEELVRLAEARGLDFLAVTDHNNITHQAALTHVQTPVMLIPGVEVTTYHGHWNIWGDAGWIDFRVHTADELTQAIQEAVRRGYLVSCNHPRPLGPDWDFREAEGYHCVEIYNGPWQYGNQHCLNFWEAHLRQGKRLVAVGGSDTHTLHDGLFPRLGYPTTFIYLEGAPSPRRLLDALRAGHAFVTHSPDGPRLTLHAGSAMMGDRVVVQSGAVPDLVLRVTGGGGLRLQLVGAPGIIWQQKITGADETVTLPLPAPDSLYLYARLINDDPDNDLFVAAVTNPLYLEHEGEPR